MRRTKNRMRLCITLLILNLTFIWGNSLIPGAFSQAISDFVKEILSAFLHLTESAEEGGFWVRKLAHFTEFACLGLLLGWLCAMRQRGRPFLWGLAAACVDETIQCFVPQRGPGLGDVCIDAGGVLFGLPLLYRFKTHWRKTT